MAATVLAVILVIIAVLALNYFRVLPVSKVVSVLNSLPQKTSIKNASIKIPCPVAKKYCSTGKQIYDGSNLLGIGFNLPANEKVYTVAIGKALFSGGEDKVHGVVIHPKVYLGWALENGSYTAVYDFFGVPATRSATLKDVEDGEAIGVVAGGSFPKEPPYSGINVLFSLQQRGKALPIDSSNFVQ